MSQASKTVPKRKPKQDMRPSKRNKLVDHSVHNEIDTISKEYRDKELKTQDNNVDTSATSVWLTLNY
jgi:hypothetical protein